MKEITQAKSNFMDIYNRSNRLAAAVFLVSNLIDQNEELKTKIKKLSLDIVSMSVRLKDTNFYDAKKTVTDIEKNSLELMSILEIASISGLVSKMNGSILKGEFQSFISELTKFSERLENNKNSSVENIFTSPSVVANTGNILVNSLPAEIVKTNDVSQIKNTEKRIENGNGHKRKDLRKNMILEFIKGHNESSMKDIVTKISGCSEKTVQRELIELIKEGKIKKIGERRWSKYSI